MKLILLNIIIVWAVKIDSFVFYYLISLPYLHQFVLYLCIDSPRNLPESQAMGVMFDPKSGIDKTDDQRNKSPIESQASSYDEDIDSDWDSWEDEEEVC